MIRSDDLALFVRAAALGNFSRAARESDLPAGQVSAAIGRLERELGMRLFARSTRSLRLTPEGEGYMPFAQDALSALEQGRQQLGPGRSGISGVLQVAAPSDLGRSVLLPWITEFQQAHPQLSLRLYLSDAVADVFRDPVDIAIRYGTPPDASYVALPLVPHNRRVLVAAPSYLRRHGYPVVAEDLSLHQCLLYLLNGRVHDTWSFTNEGQEESVRVSGNFLCDDAEVTRRWAVEGLGITYRSWLDVAADVQAGRLEKVLPNLLGEPAPLHLICPHRKQFLPSVKHLYSVLQARCSKLSPGAPSPVQELGECKQD